VTGFERLAPVVRHHVVNTLGWRELRRVQEEAVAPVLEGHNVVLLAPTAGGKTEAALFPLLTRMVDERWQGLSVLYVTPLRALLNDLEPRLSRYCGWAGRRAALWHGDTPASERRRLRADPPDCLLTTPESLEALLISTLSEPRVLFADLQAVVVDEAHAFAGDDRGWHLLAVLERLAPLAGRDLQRVGLSATVGNVEELGGWLAGSSGRPGTTVCPEGATGAAPDAEVVVDYVGSLENAATVTARLHRHDKRLVFADSRLAAERLAARLLEELRGRGTGVWVTHGSLSREERSRASEEFAAASRGVMVATSALELGLDIGDLDQVLQVDAPASVASFLQRMGRTGRRPRTRPNCVFLATDTGSLLRAAAVAHLWRHGYVEPAVPPPLPLHILAQQAIALALEEPGLDESAHAARLSCFAALCGATDDLLTELVAHLLAEGWLFRDGRRLMAGPRAEAELGHRSYLELVAVFTSPPLFTVLHGRSEVGQVHARSFRTTGAAEGPTILSLAGRAWRLTRLDWRRRRAWVAPARGRGKSYWPGSSAPESPAIAEAVREVLRGTAEGGDTWSRRARGRLEELREPDARSALDRPAPPSEAAPVPEDWKLARLLPPGLLACMVEARGGGHAVGPGTCGSA